MKTFRFVHLNVHSHYSINDGCASIRELVDAAIKDRMPGIAITDNGNMFGIMEFFDYVSRWEQIIDCYYVNQYYNRAIELYEKFKDYIPVSKLQNTNLWKGIVKQRAKQLIEEITA